MAEKPEAEIESNEHKLDSSGRHAKHKSICYNMENASDSYKHCLVQHIKSYTLLY